MGSLLHTHKRNITYFLDFHLDSPISFLKESTNESVSHHLLCQPLLGSLRNAPSLTKQQAQTTTEKTASVWDILEGRFRYLNEIPFQCSTLWNTYSLKKEPLREKPSRISHQREYLSLKGFRINVCFWETAHLPLPKPNILPKARSRC